MTNRDWMAECLRLARQGIGRTAPNPMVGAVIVRGDRLLSEGWHRAPGTAHAEVDALNRLTEPVYRPVRRFLPDMGGLDLSPLIVILGLWFLRDIMWELFQSAN